MFKKQTNLILLIGSLIGILSNEINAASMVDVDAPYKRERLEQHLIETLDRNLMGRHCPLDYHKAQDLVRKAASSGYSDLLNILLNKGGSARLEWGDINQAMSNAIRSGEVRCIDRLLKDHRIDGIIGNVGIAFVYAAEEGRFSSAERLSQEPRMDLCFIMKALEKSEKANNVEITEMLNATFNARTEQASRDILSKTIGHISAPSSFIYIDKDGNPSTPLTNEAYNRLKTLLADAQELTLADSNI